MSRSWDVLVSEGRDAVRRERDAKWRLGDLAREVAPKKVDGAHDDGRLADYADDIGKEVSSLREYRRVALAWVPSTRVEGASWTAHRELASHADRSSLLKPGMTVNEARRLAGYKPQGNERPQTPEDKANVVREYLDDEDVADEVVDAVSDNPRLTAQVVERAEEKRPAPRKHVREPSNIDLAAHLGIGHVLAHAIDKREDSIDTIVGWLRENDADDDTVRAVVEDIAKLRACGDRLHMYADELQVALDGGVSDERLAQFMEGR